MPPLPTPAQNGVRTRSPALTLRLFIAVNNTCRIAAGHLGTRLAAKRPIWNFSGEASQLSAVGLSALWLICEKNVTLRSLDISSNSVGATAEDAIGISRMLLTSTALETLRLGNNQLGDLKSQLRPIGRGLSANRTLTLLDLSSNRLYPEGTKVVCNALRACLSLKVIDLSYNSPGREPALPGMIMSHPMLQSIGIIEKEPQTRSEKTWWLDPRAKEAVGRALLASPGTVMYCQCDTFSLTESTQVLEWGSRSSCDAVILAGVLRSNTVLRTLDVDTAGELDDYSREEIGCAILANRKGQLGYSNMFGLKDGGSPQHTVDLKDKEHIRSRRSFTLFCGLIRSNTTLTSLTLISIAAEHIEVLASGLSTNITLRDLRLEAPSKGGAAMSVVTLPVQALNGLNGVKDIDLSHAGGPDQDGSQPIHRYGNAVIGELLNFNTSVQRLKLNPGSLVDGGAILNHLNRARKSSLQTLDLAGIGLGDRGGVMFFEALLDGKCKFLSALNLCDNRLTDIAIGQLMVECMRDPTCNISTLNLASNQLGPLVVAQTVKHNKTLTALDICNNPIDGEPTHAHAALACGRLALGAKTRRPSTRN